MPLKHRGLELTVMCGERELEVYQAKLEDEVTISGYIPSDAGKIFHLVGTHEGARSLICHLRIDGETVRRPCFRPRAYAQSVDGMLLSKTEYRPFKFSEISFTDTDDEDGMHDLSQIGTIEMRCFRCDLVVTAGDVPVFKTPIIKSIPESSKKIGWHRIEVDATTRTMENPSNIVNSKNTESSPYIVIRFHYQPAPLLRAKGIMPLLPRPPPVAEPLQQQSNTGSTKKRQVDNDCPDASSRKRQRATAQADAQPRRVSTPQPKAEPNDEPSTSLTVKREMMESEPESDAASDGDEEMEQIRDTLKALQNRLENMAAKKKKNKNKKAKVKSERAPSPIIVGAGNGDTIDLTSD